MSFLVSEERDHKDQTGDQEENAAEHAPKTADARNAKPDGRDHKEDPTDEIDLSVCHVRVDFDCVNGTGIYSYH